MTHGQELVTDGYDPANTEKCYAKKIETFLQPNKCVLPLYPKNDGHLMEEMKVEIARNPTSRVLRLKVCDT